MMLKVITLRIRARPEATMTPQTVLITGIGGFIAKRLAADLLAAGHSVTGSLRDPRRAGEVRGALALLRVDMAS